MGSPMTRKASMPPNFSWELGRILVRARATGCNHMSFAPVDASQQTVDSR